MKAIAIELKKLSKAFGGLCAVDGVSLQVPAGERRLLIGPNGAGKTTLFNCITGALKATSGQVIMFDRDVSSLGEHRRALLGMGRTFQITNVFTDLTVMENLVLASVGSSPRKWIMHHRVGGFTDIHEQSLKHLAQVGLTERAGDQVHLLSYGERRQLELALALASGPKVLFLDEPCAGLSPGERTRISQMVAGLPREITVVLIEHNMDVGLSLADWVTVLHRGRVIVEGPPAQVRANPQVREVYLGKV